MWPVVPHRITLRTCHDLDWSVTVSCPKCRVSRTIWPDRAPERLQSVPLEKLLAQGVFKCSKAQYGCRGTPADILEVSAMDVGNLKTVARWETRPRRPSAA